MPSHYSPPRANLEPAHPVALRWAPAVVAVLSGSATLALMALALSRLKSVSLLEIHPRGFASMLMAAALTGLVVLPFRKMPVWIAAVLAPGAAFLILMAILVLVSAIQRVAA